MYELTRDLFATLIEVERLPSYKDGAVSKYVLTEIESPQCLARNGKSCGRRVGEGRA